MSDNSIDNQVAAFYHINQNQKIMRTKLLLLPLIIMLFAPLTMVAQTVLFSDNFDSYTVGSYIVVSNPTNFQTWSGGSGGVDDVKVSDEQASSMSNSLKFSAMSAQGNEDIVVKLDNKTSGSFIVEFKIFIGDQPTAGAYFNMLQAMPPSPEWGFSLTFDPNLDMLFSWNAASIVVGTYTKGTWIDVQANVNLDTDSAKLMINNTQVAQWQWSVKESGGVGLKQLAGINFFCYAGGGANSTVLFYIDDVEFTEIVGIGVESPAESEIVKVFPNPASDIIFINTTNATEIECYTLTGALAGLFPVINGKSDISSLSPGVYVTRIITDNTVLKTRIVKL